MGKQSENQGEGNRDAARRYNRDAEEFVKSGKHNEERKRTRQQDVQVPDELTPEEREAAEHAAEHDPAERRDYSKGN